VRIAGIIPAAGYGTRLKRPGGSKEVYRVGAKPVMDYEIERMRLAPCDQLRVVTRPEKTDVIEHARHHGAVIVEGHPSCLAQSFFTGLKDLPDDHVALLGFPDSLWWPEPNDGYRHVIEFFRSGGWDVALGLLPAPDMRREEPVLYDHDSGRVWGLEFKPEHPSADRTWACAVATVGVLRGLEDHEEAGIFFNSLCPTGRVGALPLTGTFIDMGTAPGLEHALDALGAAAPVAL
jgi:dTDP-glucose pyrophosphorylase